MLKGGKSPQTQDPDAMTADQILEKGRKIQEEDKEILTHIINVVETDKQVLFHPYPSNSTLDCFRDYGQIERSDKATGGHFARSGRSEEQLENGRKATEILCSSYCHR